MTTNRMGLEQALSDGELTVITDTDHVQCGDAAAMARELLAYRKASREPIYQLRDWHWYDEEKHIYDEVTSNGGEGRIVYAAPPIQAAMVSDEIPEINRDGRDCYTKDGVRYSANYANGWNACRAAMLEKNDK